MGQLTIYLDDESIKRIEQAAAREKNSVSKWVKKRLVGALDSEWPHGFFNLFGALEEKDLSRPPQSDFEQDSPREAL